MSAEGGKQVFFSEETIKVGKQTLQSNSFRIAELNVDIKMSFIAFRCH